jgi:hypothetical protein
MKKITFVLIMILFSVPSFAKNVSLSWDASPSTGATGYKIYYGLTSDSLTDVVDAGDVLTFTLPDLEDTIGYYFGVTAYNQVNQESVLSNIVYSPGFAPPEPPSNVGGTTTVNNIHIPIK